ncbi:hypothetical protein [Streptomyces sioyaensis]|uniref:hypothetical protein n=1 Tax=Streptomyces sioyaensis TaxID=67364 RepID=UPI003D7565E7
MARGAAADIDLIAGHNRDEYRTFMLFGNRFGNITDLRRPLGPAAICPDHTDEARRLTDQIRPAWSAFTALRSSPDNPNQRRTVRVGGSTEQHRPTRGHGAASLQYSVWRVHAPAA